MHSQVQRRCLFWVFVCLFVCFRLKRIIFLRNSTRIHFGEQFFLVSIPVDFKFNIRNLTPLSLTADISGIFLFLCIVSASCSSCINFKHILFMAVNCQFPRTPTANIHKHYILIRKYIGPFPYLLKLKLCIEILHNGRY